MKQILVESPIPFSSRNIKRSETSSSNVIVTGILGTAGIINGNGRKYSRDIWEREIEKFKLKIADNNALGELDHPNSAIITLENTALNIKDIWWEGNEIWGDVEILGDLPKGHIAKVLIENNIPLGISSRGTGSAINTGGILEVQNDFELLTWDFVSTASNPGSYMRPKTTLQEGLNNFSKIQDYRKVNRILTEILCKYGKCSVFPRS